MFFKTIKTIQYRKRLKIFRDLKKTLSFNDIEKEKYQVNKLKSILKIAAKIPYYQEYLKDMNIDSLQYSDFVKLPFLTKELIRNNPDDLINTSYSKLSETYINTSGGSTGEPVKFMQTKEQAERGLANYHLANYLNGINPEDSMVVLWGALRDMHDFQRPSFYKKLRRYLTNTLTLNTYILNKEIVESYISQINLYRPKAIKAYVHSIYDIAKYINKNNIKIEGKPIIHTSTGPLYAEMRKEIKKAFNDAHVFSFYGSREVTSISTELPDEGGMIVLYDNVFVEIVNKMGDPVNEGEEGEVVVTTLNNEYMPLIRYRIGDRAVKGDKISTFGTLRLGNILGRTLGVIYTKEGKTIDGQFFTSLFFGKSGIKNFQLIQTNIDHLILKIVKMPSFSEEELDEIINRIKLELQQVTIEIQFCEKIELTATGKVMYVYSMIDEQ